MPPASQCQTSTAAFAIGLQVAESSTLRLSVSGVPGRFSAMFRRSLSPERKYGPSVSSGASTHATEALAAAAAVEPLVRRLRRGLAATAAPATASLASARPRLTRALEGEVMRLTLSRETENPL